MPWSPSGLLMRQIDLVLQLRRLNRGLFPPAELQYAALDAWSGRLVGDRALRVLLDDLALQIERIGQHVGKRASDHAGAEAVARQPTTRRLVEAVARRSVAKAPRQAAPRPNENGPYRLPASRYRATFPLASVAPTNPSVGGLSNVMHPGTAVSNIPSSAQATRTARLGQIVGHRSIDVAIRNKPVKRGSAPVEKRGNSTPARPFCQSERAVLAFRGN